MISRRTDIDDTQALLGFSVVMLLFSLVVTALVQAVQSLIRIRNATLQRGVRILMSRHERIQSTTEAKVAAKSVLNAPAGPTRSHRSLAELDGDEFAEVLDSAHRIAVANREVAPA